MSRRDLRWELEKLKFFDRPVVQDLAGKAKRVLSRFGSFVRRDARTLLRRKGTKAQPHSRPGEPPYSGPNGLLRKWVLFQYDRTEQAVVIGPMKLNIVFFRGDGEPAGRTTVPEVLEEGGRIAVLEALFRVPRGTRRGRNARGRFSRETIFEDRWMRADLRSRRRLEGKPTRLRTVRIAARPYMQPAFTKNLPHLNQWRRAA